MPSEFVFLVDAFKRDDLSPVNQAE